MAAGGEDEFHGEDSFIFLNDAAAPMRDKVRPVCSVAMMDNEENHNDSY
jgi:hypothetical protein